MNFKLSLVARVVLLGVLLPLGARAADAKGELDALVAQVQQKLQAGQRTEAALEADLAKFDALLATHKNEKTDDVARILVMKATLYIQVLQNEERGLAALKQLKANFPDTALAKDPSLDAMITSIEAQQAFAVGKVFPDFAEQDLSGKPLSIANYRGKIVLLDFWATWCPPCLAELPNVVAAYKKYHARGFEIIGISLDKPDARQKLIDFTAAHEMPWVQFYDGKYWNNKLSTRYGIRSIPATFLLDGEGRVLAKNLRGEELTDELEKRLASGNSATPAASPQAQPASP